MERFQPTPLDVVVGLGEGLSIEDLLLVLVGNVPLEKRELKEQEVYVC